MAVTYGFYNALNHDRLYDAIQMSSIFDGIIRDGIFSTIGTSMVVTAPEDGLYVNVGPGRAWFNHTWTLNDTEYPVEAEEAEVVLDRIDAVILEVNSAAEVRANSIKFLKGTPASEPVKPTLTHNAEVNQYALAYVRIRAGQSTIFQADVENAVGTEETPFVTGLMQQVSIENLILQWEAEFDDHFETWRNVNEAEFEVWSSDMQDEYNRWILNQVNTYQTWFAGIQAEAGDDIDEVMAWFEHMKGQVSEDAAIRLQEEIDDLALAAEKGSVVTVHTINQTLYGKNCVISQDGQSRTARFDNTGTAVFESIPYVGQVTVTATDGTLTAVTYLTIPYFGRYSTNLAFWAATVNISTQSPEFFSLPIKIFKDNVLIETISFSALGAATYIATSEGTYKFSVTYDNADFDHTIVIDEETTYTVVINDWNATLNMQTSVSELYGRGITISKGGVTVGTTTFNGSGRATYKVHEPGTYHIVTSTAGGDTFQANVVVTEETAYPVDLGLPNGSTALPTDDIQTWLHCAGINDKGYTTLAEVLEDSVTFNALLGDSNACDYMARSATFAGNPYSRGAMPVMTSNITPEGVCSASTEQSGHNAYNAFLTYPEESSTGWEATTAGNPSGHNTGWVQYQFTAPTKISSLEFDATSTSDRYPLYLYSYVIGGSNDGTNFTTLKEVTDYDSSVSNPHITAAIDDPNEYTYYRITLTTGAASGVNNPGMWGCKLYKELGIADDATAMSLLGRYDYACNAVLANPDWAEAIGNSEYFESVLDTKVPTMTSNTTPEGQCISSGDYSASFPAYLAFDNNADTRWTNNTQSGQSWIGYEFPSDVIVTKFSLYAKKYSDERPPQNYKIQVYSEADSNWVTVYTGINPTPDATVNLEETFGGVSSKKCRILIESVYNNNFCSIQTLQFYGRHSSQNLVPLVPTMTSNTTPSGEVIFDSAASGTQSANCYKAFDNDEATWASGIDDFSDRAWYLGYHLSQPKVANHVRFTFPSSQPAQTVATLKVQASHDGTDWTDLYTENNVVGGASASKDISFENSTAYEYYRIYCSGAFYKYYNSQVSSYLYFSYIYTLQFYGEREAGVIHSVPNDTVYYLENGVETTLCTCDANGVGEVDWSELPQGLITLYSTTAKNPNNLSNDFSMNIRVTPNKVDAFLIPDGALYWWGWVDENLEECNTGNGWTPSMSYMNPTTVAPTWNTNHLTIANASSPTYAAVGTKSPVNATTMKAIMKATSSSRDVFYMAIRQRNAKTYGNSGAVVKDTIKDYTTATLNTAYVLSLEQLGDGDFYYTYEMPGAPMSMDISAIWHET